MDTPDLRGVDGLLIEPVWNRNTPTTLAGIATPLAFNRTSMESKLRYEGCDFRVNSVF